MPIRQPIVSVLGHVDHGKTSLLDKIRGGTVASREPGAITQHIGATEVPLDTILKLCGPLVGGKEFKIPGLLFIDTPGHHSFNTLRARGGALADLAVLVIDVREGFMPQTVESVSILKRSKTPFVIAANKIDLVPGWRKKPDEPFIISIKEQAESTAEELNKMIYEFSEELYKHGFSAERYDRVEDFTSTIAMVPLSARTGEGIADLLLILIGLAQRFLEEDLATEDEPGEATVLEVKEVKGLGLTIDAILFKGVIRKGDSIIIGGAGEPIVTKVKAILKPKALEEIRDPREDFIYCDEVSAAAGIKISAAGVEDAVAGAPLKVVSGNLKELKKEIRSEMTLNLQTVDEGIIIKADAIGSLEALAFELKNSDIPIRRFDIGSVSRNDVIEAATLGDPLRKAILAFNVSVLPDAKDEYEKFKDDAALFTNNIIYKLIEDYKAWCEKRKFELEEDRRKVIAHPGKMLLLPDCTFRVSKPAIFGVRVLVGRIAVGQGLMKEDGRALGRIKSIRSGEESLTDAKTGAEVAIAVDGITVGRQVSEGDVLYIDIPGEHARKLKDLELNPDEREVLEKVAEIKRREEAFWGM